MADESEIVYLDEHAPHAQACSACGCPLDDNAQFCPACGTPHQTVNSHHASAANQVTTQTADQVAQEELDDQKHFRCENCGAEVATSPDERSYECPFCDSTYVVEYSPELTGRKPPEFVIGFAVTHEQALESFRKWIKSNDWYRPGDLALAKIEDKMRGVYLPFWSFSMLAQSNWKSSIGEYWYRTETYTTTVNGKTVTKTRRVRETEWWDLTGQHQKFYSGYLVSGSRGLPQNQADCIKPFFLPALQRYAPRFLAGWLSEEYSVEEDDALQRCKQEFSQREKSNIGNFLPGDTYNNLQVNSQFSQVNSDLILLPVYLISYRYKDKLYRFLVNGQTGKYSGNKPVSWARINTAIGVGVGVVVGLILLVLLLNAIFGG